MNRKWISTAMLLALAGCAAKNAPAPEQAVKAAEPTAVLRGTVTYREGVALPPDAMVDVWIADISPGFVAAVLLGENSFPTGGKQVPISFEVPYDPKRVAPDHLYGVKAVIRSGDRTMFETTNEYRVITQGNPNQLELVLTRLPDPLDSPPPALLGMSWRLAEIGGEPALTTPEATLEFFEAGRIGGSGSCNRFFGTMETSGSSLKLGALGTTRTACTDSLAATQESKYLYALQRAERYTIEGDSLLIYWRGSETPLRFVRKEP